jgi:hypothetical protein
VHLCTHSIAAAAHVLLAVEGQSAHTLQLLACLTTLHAEAHSISHIANNKLTHTHTYMLAFKLVCIYTHKHIMSCTMITGGEEQQIEVLMLI